MEGREGGPKGGVQAEDGEGAPGYGEGEVRAGDGATPLDPEGGEGCRHSGYSKGFFVSCEKHRLTGSLLICLYVQRMG